VSTTVEESIDVDVPVRTAYDQWTQFEEFPKCHRGRGAETGAWRGEVSPPT